MEKKTIDNSKFSKEAQDIIFANEVISTLNIKGKDYAEVNQRVKAFRLVHPYGKIETQILKLEGGFVLFKAIVSDKDGNILATGHAYEIQESSLVNKTSFIENGETSAIGRALGMCGYGIDTSLASADEVKNAIERQDKIVAKEQAKAQEQEKTTSNAQDKKKFYEIMNLTEKGKLLTLSEVGKLAIKIHGSYIDINELNQDEFNELKEQVKGIIEEKRANREKKELEKVKSQKDLEREAVEAFKYQDVDFDDKPSDEENEQFKSDLWGE